MLNSKLALHDIADAEAFVTALIPRDQKLAWQDQEDLTAWLISECWILSTRYQPGRITFSTWAGHTLRQRIHDWTRQRKGRTKWTFSGHTYQRTIPELVSYEQEANNSANSTTSHNIDTPSRRLTQALTTTPRHTPTDRPTALPWLHGERGSSEAWDPHTRRPRLPRRAA